MKRLLAKSFIILFSIVCINATYAHLYKGQLQILVIDDFKHKRSVMKYQLREDTNIYDLIIPKTINKKELSTGDDLIVEGDLVSGEKIKTIQINKIKLNKKSKTHSRFTLDKRNVLSIIIDFSDKKATDVVSVDSINQQLYQGSMSVKNNFSQSSFSQLILVEDTDGDGQPDIFTVDLNYPINDTCNVETWTDDAKNALAAQGVNLDLYRHFMFILPQGTNCPYSGAAYLGCDTTCKAWILGNTDIQFVRFVMAHELGHTLGFDHSSTDLNNDGINDGEYNDLSCIMGSAYRAINAPHRDSLHWFGEKQIKTVTSSGQYTINPLDKLSTKFLQTLKINKNDGTGTYYISFRTADGPFGMAAPYLLKVNIHRVAAPAAHDAHSYFITALGTGDSFVDSNNHIKVKVISIRNHMAKVDINLT
jgi:hypothetical protein